MWLRLVALSAVAAVLQSVPSPRELRQGDESNIDSARQVVVRTPAEWETLWRQHSPDTARPQVDFSTDMVLALFLGSRPTPGYAVNIASVTNVGDGLIVRYRETKPPPGSVSIQVLTFPFHMVLIPQRAGRITFDLVN
jgi:PrcB C-terminal